MTRTCIGRRWMVLLAALTGAGIGACRTPAPTARSHTTLRQRSTRPEAAFAAAEQALRERFRIELRDPKRGLLRTAAVETRDRVQGGRVGDALGTPRRVRKIAEVRVEPDGPDVSIWCRVTVEQDDTNAHQLFVQDQGLSDIPSDTPPDREGATTARQHTVWRAKGRDRQLEREIRLAIQELLDETAGPTKSNSSG